jgi:hypothetical protein
LLNSQTGRNKYGTNQHNGRKTVQTANPKGQSDPGKQKDHAAKEFKDKFGPVWQNKYWFIRTPVICSMCRLL